MTLSMVFLVSPETGVLEAQNREPQSTWAGYTQSLKI